jgi:hypothetical protein
MTTANPQANRDALIQALEQAVAEVLGSRGEGISEHELITELGTYPELSEFLDRKNGDTLALFRIHFLVSHVLYRLRDRWHEGEEARLEIAPLAICKYPYRSGDSSLTEVDKVRDYYLDLTNLSETGEREVDELIASFWIGMNRFEHRDEALQALGLTDPVDDETIRRAYRSLVMQHHPDRGGDKEIIQQLNDAAHLLLKT